MDYLLYEPEDFAADESYLRYYFKLNDADVVFWETWISNHPERLDVIINADQLIAFVHFQLPKEEVEQEFQRLDRAIATSGTEAAVVPFRKTLVRKFQWAAAVAVVLLFSAGIIYYFQPKKPPVMDALSRGLIETKNNSDSPKRLQLADGSVVTLQPGSVLAYPKTFSPEKREVYLDGEAFFNVKRDTSRSFFVYYNNVVTHVLGTSFNVKTDKMKRQVEVSVKTGRVEVYEKTENKDAIKSQGNGVILTPNQRVVYSEDSKRFDASIVDVPLPIPSVANKDSHPVMADVVHETSFGSLLSDLEILYGIDIEVEDDNIRNCHFSGDLSDMNLYVKLDIMCQALNASYENKGTRIIVRGKGCN